MTIVVIRHDRSIADALEDTRSELTIVDTDSKSEALTELPDADVFVVNPSNWENEYIDSLQSGTWVQATSAGYATFPIETFEERDIIFTNASGNYGPPVADHAFSLILALARDIPSCLEAQKRREWNRAIGTYLVDLESHTLTVVGLGNIGKAVARRGLGFGMTVYGTKRTPASYDGQLPDEHVFASDALDDLLPETDVLVLAVPLTDETRHLIDESMLERLPDSAIVINVARGDVIVQDALVEALESKRIAGAGLDVFEEEPLPESSPLWDRDDVIVTPHVAGRSENFARRFVDLFLTNFDRMRDDEQFVNRIV